MSLNPPSARSSTTTRLIAAFSLLGVGSASLSAQSVWSGVDSSYATAGNWTPSGIPTGAADANRALFNGGGSAAVTLDNNRTARLAFDSTTTSYTISGGSFVAGAGADLVRVEAANTANHTVNSNIYFGATTTGAIVNIRNNSTAATTMTFGGAIGGQSAVAGLTNNLQFYSATANGRVILNGVVSDILPGRTGAGNVVLQKIGGSSSLGNLTLNGNNTHTGGTEFYTGSGSLTVGHANALGAGELRVYGGLNISANTDLSGPNALANTVRFNGTVSNVTNTTDITGTVGSNSVTVTSATNLAVGQQINYSAAARPFPIGTYITAISGNTLTLSNAIPTGAATTVSSGAARFQSFGSGSSTHTITGTENIEFSGTMYLGSSRADAGTATQNFNVTNTGVTTFSGSLTQENSIEAGNGLVVGALTKSGSGTLVLSGTNNYTGATIVATNGGTLLINGDNSAATGNVTVNSGGTLGGSGTIGGNTTIGAGGILAPGNSPGVLSFAGNLSLNGTAVSNFEINGLGRGTGYDGVDIDGNTALGGTLNINFGTTILAGGDFDLFDMANTPTGSFALISLLGSYEGTLVSGVTQTISGQDFTFNASTGNLLVTAAIPEPSTFAALAGLGALGLVAARRRRSS